MASCDNVCFHVEMDYLFTIVFISSPVSLAPSSGSWSHVNGGGGGGMLEYDVPLHAPQSYSYSKASYSHSTHSR